MDRYSNSFDAQISGFKHNGVNYRDYTGWSSNSGADPRIDEGGYDVQDYMHNSNGNDWRNEWYEVNTYYRPRERASREYY